jgi:hypothetical protein
MMTLNAFITGIKNGQVQRETTLLQLAFNTATKESLCMGGSLQHREGKNDKKVASIFHFLCQSKK